MWVHPMWVQDSQGERLIWRLSWGMESNRITSLLKSCKSKCFLELCWSYVVFPATVCNRLSNTWPMRERDKGVNLYLAQGQKEGAQEPEEWPQKCSVISSGLAAHAGCWRCYCRLAGGLPSQAICAMHPMTVLTQFLLKSGRKLPCYSSTLLACGSAYYEIV